ncbi:MAG TPA: alpha-amylase family glycosyl hydrolase [Fibrobacteria bacterium]|nr:alpha-amylase family glycosyl hydrolase [Fibrobacteria bacterium]
MPVPIEPNAPDSLSAADLAPRKTPVHPSPQDWRDQILYFLLPDRFCDDAEAARPKYSFSNPPATAPKAAWMAGGKGFQGGTLKGIRSKLGYLRDLGVTALWIGPVFKQRVDLETYHGYGIQDFLEVDPRFGTRQELRNLVDAAHDLGIYVLLDIIYNHSGNNWFYDQGGHPAGMADYRYEPPRPIHGWRSETGTSVPQITNREQGVWPREFQGHDWYTRAGKIGNWDPQSWENPLDPRNEFRRGDFFDLKDFQLNEFEPRHKDVLNALIKVYQYWISLTDCDGIRVDTVKHVPFEASRNFCGGIHEFAESIGKENFLVLGEVTGGSEMSKAYLDIFGRNLDAAIDLGGPMDTLANFAKGLGDGPEAYFRQFGGHDALGSHREVGRYHVSMFDDHDMISRDPKGRICHGNASPFRFLQAAHAVGVQLTCLGIPCIYYGTEQAFDGGESYHDASLEALEDGKPPFRDRYVRESMFGGTFGAFQTSGLSFFDPGHPAYRRIAAIASVVKRRDKVGKALRRGRQYPREVQFLAHRGYLPPVKGELVAWSRILFDQEVLVALNTNGEAPRGGFATVDSGLHPPGSSFRILYRSDWSDAELAVLPVGRTLPVIQDGNRAVVRLDLPEAGMIILA